MTIAKLVLPDHWVLEFIFRTPSGGTLYSINETNTLLGENYFALGLNGGRFTISDTSSGIIRASD